MDLIKLYDIIEENRDWEVHVLPECQGILIGDYDTINYVLKSLNLSERYIDGS